MPSTLNEHYGYLSDQQKRAAYEHALSRVIRPEHVVLDLGCGSGLLGLMALRLGAKKVLFVEEGAVIEVARQTVARAGFDARAEFFRVNSYELELPVKADVIVCDHVGYFGIDYGILNLLADARQRLLQADGIVVPESVALHIALVESERCRELVGKWQDGSVPDEFSWLAETAANSKHSVQLTAADLLSEPAVLEALQLGRDVAPFLSWTRTLEAHRNGTIDGVAGWFDCCLVEDICMSNSPVDNDALNRPLALLPLHEAVPVKAGERVETTIMQRHREGIIAWALELEARGQRVSQTTFEGLLLDDEAMSRSNPERPASLNTRGKARQVILSYCDGKRSITEVEALVLARHADLMPSEAALTEFVRSVLQWETG